jgi:hypothetical protein
MKREIQAWSRKGVVVGEQVAGKSERETWVAEIKHI